MKSIKTFLLVLFLGFLSTSTFCFGQFGGPSQLDLERSFELDDSYSIQTNELDSLITWQERIIIHVDKSVITKNSLLFFKAYILTGPNRVRATLSKVLKIELTNKDQQTVASQYHKIEDGISEGALVFPKKMDEGTYTLRAYTRWMQNYGEPFFFTKELQFGSNEKMLIIDKESTEPFSITFHPEGGNLIANFSNRLLMKIDSEVKRIVDVHAKIVDSEGKEVATAVPFGPQLMSAIFIPKPDERYTLNTSNGFSFPLPKSLSKGILLNVNNIDPTSLSIRIQATPEFVNTKVRIKGEMGGITYFTKEIELAESSAKVDVQKQGIPFGVMTVSLLDEDGIQWAKRPVSFDTKNDLKLDIVPMDQDTGTDELIFKVKVTDSKGKPIATEVSLSATNLGNNPGLMESPDGVDFNWQSSIRSSDDGDYHSRRRERYLTDLNLLTGANGDNDMISQTIPEKIKYPFQQGLDLIGYAYNLDNELLKNTKIQMLATSGANVIAEEFKTDSFGRIRLENLEIVGETELVFRTVGEDTSSRLVKIIPLQEDFEPQSTSTSKLELNPEKRGKIVKTSPWQPYDKDEVVELEEVEVIQRKLQEKKTMPSVYGIEPSLTKIKFQDVERPKTIPQLFLGIPGVQVIGLGTIHPSVNLPRAAGQGPVLWVLDGMPLMKPLRTTQLASLMNIVNYTDVERIEVLFGPQASIYGSRAAGGAIIVYTRSGAGLDYLNRKEGHLNFQGYFESPTFESYVKKMSKNPNKYKSKAATLFWDPKIKTDENGEATVRFDIPIEYDRLELRASVVTAKGKIGSAKLVF
ncbi:MAG: TonB-dependent receptor plug domain-containing protein [Maribacter sp.]|nr:TonB-dependent receptor plug domain-containing protein [Maribacter sp.]